MSNLEKFMQLLCRHFDNAEQFHKFNQKYPYAEHINTICNHKITGLPHHFQGILSLKKAITHKMEPANPCRIYS